MKVKLDLHRFLAVVLFAVACMVSGCVNVHEVRGLSETYDDGQRRINADKAAEIAGNAGLDEALRGHAFRALGRLRVYSPRVQRAFDSVIPDQNSGDDLRRMAIWALGEVGRETAWERGGKSLHTLVLRTLRMPLSRTSSLQLVEAVAKVYPQHAHTAEEDRQTFLALNALQAKYRQELPGLYYTVLNLVADLASLSDALAESLEKTNAGADEEGKARIYGAAMALLRNLEDNRVPILANFASQRARVTYAFETLTTGFNRDEKRLTLMVVWSLGRLASDPRLGRIVAQSLSELLPNDDPALAFLAAWALVQMDDVTGGREGLRTKILNASVDPQILQMVALRDGHDGLDIIQSLYGMTTEDPR